MLLLRLTIIISIFSLSFSFAQKGSLKGKITDQDTRTGIPGVNVIVEGTSTGSSADFNGSYIINNLPAGTYTLRFSCIGYETFYMTDVSVKPGRITFADAELVPKIIRSDEISVTAGYFQKNISDVNPVGFNEQEIRRAPGSMGDVSRILLSLPGTAKIRDDQNDLAVRGGSPIENGFYIDGIPVPNINHFPGIGSTGGPTGILNIDFIDNVNFLASGFNPSYGDRLSSVIDIKFREGNKEQFQGQADLNLSGFGGGIEGPLPGETGSYMISGKKSYLDIIMDAFFKSGAMPRMSDLQGKITLNLNQTHKLTLLNIFAENSEDFDSKDAADLDSDIYGSIKNYQNTLGVTVSSLWNSSFYSTTSLSHNVISFENTFNKVVDNKLSYSGKNIEQSFTLRNLNFLCFNDQHKIEFGGELNYAPGTYDYRRMSDTSVSGEILPDFILNKKIITARTGFFANYIMIPFDRLTINIGLRDDYYLLNKSNVLSPRVSVSYDLSSLTRIFLNGGIYYQQLPRIILSQKPEFEKLINIKARQFGIGFEHLLNEDTRLTFELYDKEYSYLPLDPEVPYLSVVDDGLTNNGFGSYGSLISSGKAYTRGAEFMIQKKLAENFYGLISGSYFRSRYRDAAGKWYDRVYDNKFIFSMIGGWKPDKEWELSVRWIYAGGSPYTPFDRTKSLEVHRGIIDINRINADRYPDYHSLSIRIDKKFYFSSQSIDLYVSLWNIYDRKNVAEYIWNSGSSSQKASLQWGLLPIIGVEYEL